MIQDAERRFGEDNALIARLESLEGQFPEHVALLPKGMSIFGIDQLVVKQTPFGEGIALQSFANDDSNRKGELTKPLVVYFITDEDQISRDGTALNDAIAKGFDGVMSIPTLHGDQRPYEIILPSIPVNDIPFQAYTKLSHVKGRRSTITEAAQRLADEFTDAMPMGTIHFGDFKVRRNWWHDVVVGLDYMRTGYYPGEISEELRDEIDMFIDNYRRRGLYSVLTPWSDIRKANMLLSRIEEQN